MTTVAVIRDQRTHVELGAGRSLLDARALLPGNGLAPGLSARRLARAWSGLSPSQVTATSARCARAACVDGVSEVADPARTAVGSRVSGASGASASSGRARCGAEASWFGFDDDVAQEETMTRKTFGTLRLPDASVVLEHVPATGVPTSVDAVLLLLQRDHEIDLSGAMLVLDRADAQGLVRVDDHGVVWRVTRPAQQVSA